ncbi:MAG TPA: 5'/3'-nucleotidase SurE [Verrucomicrobiaceae bacterium]|jgi:5'-nucleotidase
MHFLLTNDDGIHAPGLAALAQAVRTLPDARITIVAPEEERSMCGHRITTRERLIVERIDEMSYGVSGTPADCVRVAIFALGMKPDFVVSGVNAGGNLGQDLPVSGTVAAAREAAFHGLPAIAVSHYLVKDLAVDWARASAWTAALLREWMPQRLGDGEFWNVNLPHLPEGEQPLPQRVSTQPSRAPLGVSYAQGTDSMGRMVLQYNATYAERPAPAGSDVAVCFGGRVSVSRLSIL